MLTRNSLKIWSNFCKRSFSAYFAWRSFSITSLYKLFAWTHKAACFKGITEQHVLTVVPKRLRHSPKKCFAKKPVAEISLLKKKNNNQLSLNKNNSAEKIIVLFSCAEKGLWPKTSSENGLWPKRFWYWKGKWSKLCQDKEGLWWKKHCFSLFIVKSRCLKWLSWKFVID